MTIITLQPRWPKSSPVVAHSTTRLGGVSQPPFDSLNLGLHVGDDPDAVSENRSRLNRALNLPSSPAWLRQVHGVEIARLEEPHGARSAVLEVITADAAITSTPGVVLAILTADCLPVVVTDAEGTNVAVAHAGWRGLASGILERVVDEFPAESELHAWLGPAIGPAAFEVGEEVFEAFCASDSGAADAFVPMAEPGKYLADLYTLARLALTRQRPASITGGDCCTFTDARRLHSYRRDGANSGRQATLAWIEESNRS